MSEQEQEFFWSKEYPHPPLELVQQRFDEMDAALESMRGDLIEAGNGHIHAHTNWNLAHLALGLSLHFSTANLEEIPVLKIKLEIAPDDVYFGVKYIKRLSGSEYEEKQAYFWSVEDFMKWMKKTYTKELDWLIRRLIVLEKMGQKRTSEEYDRKIQAQKRHDNKELERLLALRDAGEL